MFETMNFSYSLLKLSQAQKSILENILDFFFKDTFWYGVKMNHFGSDVD